MIREGSVTHSSLTTYYQIVADYVNDSADLEGMWGVPEPEQGGRREGVIMEKSFTAVSKAMFGTDVRQEACSSESMIDLNAIGDGNFGGSNVNPDDDDNLLNQVNAVKDADGGTCYNHVDDLVKKFRVLLENHYEQSTANEDDNKESVTPKCEDETLEQFNCYNYWKMPLDTSVIDTEHNSQDSNSTVSLLFMSIIKCFPKVVHDEI